MIRKIDLPLTRQYLGGISVGSHVSHTKLLFGSICARPPSSYDTSGPPVSSPLSKLSFYLAVKLGLLSSWKNEADDHRHHSHRRCRVYALTIAPLARFGGMLWRRLCRIAVYVKATKAIRDVIMLCRAESTYGLKTRKYLLPVNTLTDIIIITLLLYHTALSLDGYLYLQVLVACKFQVHSLNQPRDYVVKSATFATSRPPPHVWQQHSHRVSFQVNYILNLARSYLHYTPITKRLTTCSINFVEYKCYRASDVEVLSNYGLAKSATSCSESLASELITQFKSLIALTSIEQSTATTETLLGSALSLYPATVHLHPRGLDKGLNKLFNDAHAALDARIAKQAEDYVCAHGSTSRHLPAFQRDITTTQEQNCVCMRAYIAAWLLADTCHKH